ncbi:MAG: dephospho-CoA kinase [Ignavibacteria bacterium]|nr:dephospho-CoA kinase [Ignavibacteria bacterium]
MKLKIGITGGIGSGKSLAASFFESKGYPVIYADKVAKELYNSDRTLLKLLVKEFGKGILDNKGKFNSINARKIIFLNRKNIKRVNSIVHPFVLKQIDEISAKINSNIVFIEAAIMFESGSYKKMDYVLLIFANKKTRIKRIMKRDKIKQSEVLKLMNLQMNEQEKLKRADFIIKNNGSSNELFAKLNSFCKKLNQL